MEYPKPKITIEKEQFDILSYEEFREKRGLPSVTNQTIINHMEKGNLDFCQIGHFRYVIWNKKASNFNLNYQKQLNTIN